MEYPKSKYPLPQQDYMVVIKCFTYNQANYIEEALKGFVMQKTNFPFCALVVDDFSSDNTADIIRKYEAEYPEIIKGVYLQENYYSQGGIKREKTEIVSPWFDRCKYIAMCEGDDYWTDPLKLQKQVDIMESNPDVDLVWTRAKCFSQNKHTFLYDIGKKVEDFDGLLLENVIPTLTVLYRRGVLEPYHDFIGDRVRSWKMGDYPLWLYIALHGRIHFLDEVTAVYRYLEESASHSKSYDTAKCFQKSAHSIRSFYLAYSKKINEDLLQDNYNHIRFCLAFQYHEYKEAISYYRQIDKRSLTSKDRLKYMISYVCLALRLRH